MALLFDVGTWIATKDCDPRAFALYRRHYSFKPYADHRRSDPSSPTRFSFIGPGQKMVLVNADYTALFGWRKFIDDSGQTGVNCCVFRNESCQKSSDMIRAAEELAWRRWPGERFYTMVNAHKVLSKNPGYCFIKAGWVRCGKTKGGLIILEKLPS